MCFASGLAVRKYALTTARSHSSLGVDLQFYCLNMKPGFEPSLEGLGQDLLKFKYISTKSVSSIQSMM